MTEKAKQFTNDVCSGINFGTAKVTEMYDIVINYGGKELLFPQNIIYGYYNTYLLSRFTRENAKNNAIKYIEAESRKYFGA